jgi:hypothetical protein
MLGWVAVVIVGGLAHAILWLISEPEALFSDFYKAYYPVAEYLWLEGPARPWPPLEVGAGGFVNLPIVGWLFAPLVAFGEDGSSWVYLAIGASLTTLAWLLLTRSFAARSPVLLLLFLANGPLVNSLREGNSTHVILLLLTLAVLLWRANRGFAAGAVLAVCGIIKLPLLLLGVYFAARGRWKIVAGGATTIVGVLLLSVLVHGLDVHVSWYRDSVEPFLGGVIAAFNVQSIDGFMLRLATGTADLLDWVPHRPSLAHRIARYATVAILLGGSFWLMWRAGLRAVARPPQRRDLIEFCMVLTLSLVISPISWSHYYLLMLLPAALCLGGHTLAPQERRWRVMFWAGFALTSLPVVILPLPESWLGGLAARTIISLWLAGGLLIFAAHAHALWEIGRGTDRAAPR